MSDNRQPGNPDTSKITALYERLSQEDESQGPSNSIVNQKSTLEEYARKNGFANIRHFWDDGVSGTTFERKWWKAMIAEVEAGNVSTVIVKDLSRVGRDYLKVGYFTEVLFREKDVRFIAVANGIDSEDSGSGEFAPFMNIMAEWYARDASRKITAVMRSKAKEGKRLTTVPIYGYAAHPEDKDQWVTDPEAAEVVRRIYRLTIEGKGPHQIAKILTEEKVERPSVYLSRRETGSYKNRCDTENPYTWNGATVAGIISKPEYMGHTVNGRSRKESYKDKQAKKVPKEEWLIFENTHEAIIDPETWETAQRCRKTIKRTDSLGEANPLTGKLFCADCGARMYNHRKPYTTPHYNHHGTGKTYTRCPSDIYSCSTHDNGLRKFQENCTLHYIRTAVVRELALDAIRTVSGYVRENEAEFIRRVREASNLRQEETAKAHKKRIAKNEKRIAELDMLFRKTYEDNATGKLTDERFAQLSGDYEREQAELKKQTAGLRAELDGFVADSLRADRFIGIVKKYTDFTELSGAMINEFIEKILVHEADRSNGEREQQVDIYLNFIGKFDVPVSLPEPTPEEIAEAEKKRKFREKRREYERRYIAKKRARLEKEKRQAMEAEQEQTKQDEAQSA